MEKVCYIDDYGDICLKNGRALRDPAVLLLPEEDILIKYGDFNDLQAYLDKISKKYMDPSVPMPGPLNPARGCIVGLGYLGKPIACYIINRMATADSGFVKSFYEHAQLPEPMKWLEAEMQRVPDNTERN